MLNNISLGLKMQAFWMATGMWLVGVCFAFGGQPSPFDALDDAPTPAAREALMQQWRAALPPISHPITPEEREMLIQRFIVVRNPAILEVIGPELVLALAKRFRTVAMNAEPVGVEPDRRLRYALIDAVVRADLPEQIKAAGRGALLEGFNSPNRALRSETASDFAYREKEAVTDALLRMIDEPEERDRGLALELLGKFGRPDAAPVIAEKLRQRAKGLDRKAILNDFTFQSGRNAIERLTARAREAQGLTPVSTPKPETAVPGVPPGLVRMSESTPGFWQSTPPPSPNTPATRDNAATGQLGGATPPSPNIPAAQAPTSAFEHRTPVWPWLVGIAALIAILALVFKRRV